MEKVILILTLLLILFITISIMPIHDWLCDRQQDYSIVGVIVTVDAFGTKVVFIIPPEDLIELLGSQDDEKNERQGQTEGRPAEEPELFTGASSKDAAT